MLCSPLFVVITVNCGWSWLVDMARIDDSMRKLQTALLLFCAEWLLFRNLCAMYTSVSKTSCCCSLKRKQTKWAAWGSSCETLDETLRGSHPMTNVFRVCYSAPREWQPDKVREKNRQIKWSTHQRREKWDDKRGKTSIKLFSNSLLRLY